MALEKDKIKRHKKKKITLKSSLNHAPLTQSPFTQCYHGKCWCGWVRVGISLILSSRSIFLISFLFFCDLLSFFSISHFLKYFSFILFILFLLFHFFSFVIFSWFLLLVQSLEIITSIFPGNKFLNNTCKTVSNQPDNENHSLHILSHCPTQTASISSYFKSLTNMH